MARRDWRRASTVRLVHDHPVSKLRRFVVGKERVFYALGKPRFEGQIIPLLYQPCDYERLSWTLSFSQMVDFTQDFNEGCVALMRVWGLGYST